jgi:serine/threonine-protein kinase
MSRDELSIGNGVDASASEDAEVARVLDEYLAELEAGRPADPDRLLADHPAIASQLRACLEVMHLAGRVADEPDPRAGNGSDPGSGATAVPLAPSLRSTWNVGNGPPPRVRLHDLDEEEPLVRPRSPAMPATPEGTWGRYQLQGEIARGGMGAVIKGRDVDLGRDLAIKVLLESHRGNSQVVRRFIEEAQIGGQLQHPGIVPVYDLGTCADRRPYFAMKLVKGRTLASMLQARAVRSAVGAGSVRRPDRVEPGGPGRADACGPGRGTEPPPTEIRPPTDGLPTYDDLPRFLSIFEQVCQTMAYAHARGVIHRDLKPSNVMVGSFGEVQVMDWGLAKVLARGGVADESPVGTDSDPPGETVIMTVRTGPAGSGSESQAGSVLGTPAYMAPEQARGDVERLDERVDVFGLGAILCEVLTGRPPFAGPTREEVRARAARSDLADALGRLDACRADAELIALAKDCLTAEPEHRPRDAAEVARRMSAYQTGVRERLRAAELARVEAQARVEEERKRRRVTVALAASVAVTAGVIGGGWAYLARHQQRRAAQVDLTLREAEVLRDEAAKAGDDLKRWAEARDAARAVQRLLADARDRATQQRVMLLVEQVSEAARAAETDQKLLARLMDARSDEVDDFDGWATEGAYADAFREAGIDLSSPIAAAERIKARPTPVAVALSAALDNWAAVRRNRRRDRAGAQTLIEVASTADPDIWRGRLRRILQVSRGRDLLRDLRELARSGRIGELPAVSLDLLGGALLGVGDLPTAEAVLRGAQQRYPTDVLINCDLAKCLERQARRGDAIRYYTAVRALRPELSHALAHALEEQGETDQAISLLQDQVRRRSEEGGHLVCLGRFLKNRGRTPEARTVLLGAITILREQLRRRPDQAAARNHLGLALTRLGRPGEAIAEYREAIRLRPGDAIARVNLGQALREQGRLDEAIEQLREAIRIVPDDAGAHSALALALHQQGRHADAISEHWAAIRLRPDDANARNNFGHNLREQGRLDEAIEQLREAIQLKSDFAGAHDNLGLALWDKGKLVEAMVEWREAIRLDPDLADAHHNLGIALDEQGKAGEAVFRYREAIRLDPNHAQAHNNLGAYLCDRVRDYQGAVAQFREAIRLRPGDPDFHYNLGNALSGLGKLDEAIIEYRGAIRLRPDLPKAHYDLGNALLARGKLDEAIPEFREAIRLKADFAEAHCNLGEIFRRQGRFVEALAEVKRGHEFGLTRPDWRYPSAQLVCELERLVELDKRLPAVLDGRSKPADAAEWMSFAQLCYEKKLHGASARLWNGGFQAQPRLAGDLQAQHRYNATCAAALAGCGQGKDDPPLDEAARARWRKQALDWLKSDLAAWTKILESRPPQSRASIDQTLQRWKADADLAGLRDPAALGKLPEYEQKACRALWVEVDALLKKARDAKP